MKFQVGAYFFLFLMLVKTGIAPLVYLDYEFRHDYIVKYLCVNRDKPALNCDGKCYLAKRMAAAQEKEQREAERNFVFQLYETQAEPLTSFNFGFPDNLIVFSDPENTPAYLSSLAGRLLISGIFHPPLH